MTSAFENSQSHQDRAAAREPLVDINTEPTQSVDPESESKPRRKRLSDVQDPVGDAQPEPETKPLRRRLGPAKQAHPPEPASEPQTCAGRPRISISPSQTAVLDAPADADAPDDADPPVKQHRARLSSKPVPDDSAQTRMNTAGIEPSIADLRAEQNFPVAVIGGFVAAAVSALIWAVISITTNCQIGWMAIGVGFLVGGVVRVFGRGLDKRFGYLGAGMALFGCLLGNCLTYCVLIARDAELSMAAVLTQVSPMAIPKLMIFRLHPLDILFYVLALYEGYRFSFLRITKAQAGSAVSK